MCLAEVEQVPDKFLSEEFKSHIRDSFLNSFENPELSDSVKHETEFMVMPRLEPRSPAF